MLCFSNQILRNIFDTNRNLEFAICVKINELNHKRQKLLI